MPAHNDMNSLNDDDTTRSASAWSEFQIAQHGLTVLCVAIGLYAFLVGVSALRGALPLNAIRYLIAPVPLALALWFGFGFMQSPQTDSSNDKSNDKSTASPDFGLLLSCAGWGLTALALFIPSSQNNENVTATVCGVLGLLCLMLGSVLSMRAWMDVVKR